MTNQALQNLTPRHIEIMNRLMAGQRQKEIAADLDITQARLSVIVHSPLFQLELQKKQAIRVERFVELQEGFLEASLLGVRFHKEVLEKPTDPINKGDKMKSAITMTALASRLIRNPQPSLKEEEEVGEGSSYEERLRKVTYEETVRKVDGGNGRALVPQDVVDLLEENYPPEDSLIEAEEASLFSNPEEDDPLSFPADLNFLQHTQKEGRQS